jgi:hypothetical protein
MKKHQKSFLQGLKPIGSEGLAPGLKPRPPKEKEAALFRTRKAMPTLSAQLAA